MNPDLLKYGLFDGMARFTFAGENGKMVWVTGLLSYETIVLLMIHQSKKMLSRHFNEWCWLNGLFCVWFCCTICKFPKGMNFREGTQSIACITERNMSK